MLSAPSFFAVDHPSDPQSAGSDRRGEARQPALLRASLQLGSEEVDCVIVDLSSTGVQVRTDERRLAMTVCVGQQMILTPLGGESMTVIVRRINGHTLGLQFLTAIGAWALAPAVRKSRRIMRERPGRAQISLPTLINTHAGQCQGRIINIAIGGGLVETRADLKFGDQIMLATDLVRPIGCYVRWQKRGQIGVMFNRLLPVESANIIATEFNIYPVWMEEIRRCHEGVRP